MDNLIAPDKWSQKWRQVQMGSMQLEVLVSEFTDMKMSTILYIIHNKQDLAGFAAKTKSGSKSLNGNLDVSVIK